MNVIFKEVSLKELYESGTTSNRKYKKICKNKSLVDGYLRAVGLMYNVASITELSQFSFLHYEKLKHRPESSVRLVNGLVERLLFTETEDGIEVELIEIDSTHYGNKK